MTNFEKIKSMTIDEMAEFFCGGEFGCGNCAYNDNPNRCEKEVNRHKEWLERDCFVHKLCPYYQGVCGLDERILCYCGTQYEKCEKYKERTT